MKNKLNFLTFCVCFGICSILYVIGFTLDFLAGNIQRIIDYIISIPNCGDPDCEFHNPK